MEAGSPQELSGEEAKPWGSHRSVLVFGHGPRGYGGVQAESMPLRIAMVDDAPFGSNLRMCAQAELLAARGDDVVVFAPEAASDESAEAPRLHHLPVPARAASRGLRSWAPGVWSRAAPFLSVLRAHLQRPFDVAVIHAAKGWVLPRVLASLAGPKTLIDVSAWDGSAVEGLVGVGGGVARVAGVELADALVAAHPAQYDALLARGVRARKLGIVVSSVSPEFFVRRKKGPRLPSGTPARLVVHVAQASDLPWCLSAVDRLAARDVPLAPTVVGRPEVIGAAEADHRTSGVEVSWRALTSDADLLESLRGAHLAVVTAEDVLSKAGLPRALLAAVSVGVPTIVPRTLCLDRLFGGRSVVSWVEPGDVEGLADEIQVLATDGTRRKHAAKQMSEWEAEYGFAPNRQVFYRTVDALCSEKITRERRARQKAVEGKKTGTRKTPPKSGSASKPKPPSAGRTRPSKKPERPQAPQAQAPISVEQR